MGWGESTRPQPSTHMGTAGNSLCVRDGMRTVQGHNPLLPLRTGGDNMWWGDSTRPQPTTPMETAGNNLSVRGGMKAQDHNPLLPLRTGGDNLPA